MPYKENLKKATALKTELDHFRPLEPETEKRIMQKFRLDWNYHSSHIEGNQLTFGETKALILFGTTAQAKPLKDHIEMTGHNEAVLYIEDIIRQERPLTEAFIRELHQIILKESYEVDAITPDGQPTKKHIAIGKYKTQPNHVQTRTGEMFYFASPEETPAKMEELMIWYNENKDNNDIHPILFATEFHYRFIRIHPFDDGNGRIARLLMNFLLLRKGYPPAIIKTEEKAYYFSALQIADSGQIEFFFNYVCEQVIYSLELMLKGARGENIEDEDDLDKKLALLKQEIDTEDEAGNILITLSIPEIGKIIQSWAFKLLYKISETTKKFNQFYERPSQRVYISINSQSTISEVNNELKIDDLQNQLGDFFVIGSQSLDTATIKLTISFRAYKKGGMEPFSCEYSIAINFSISKYKLTYEIFDIQTKQGKHNTFTQRLLHQPLEPVEINEINKQWGESLFNHLEYHRKKLKSNDNK